MSLERVLHILLRGATLVVTKPDDVFALIEAGVDINQLFCQSGRGVRQWAIGHYCIENKWWDALRALVGAGLNPNQRDLPGNDTQAESLLTAIVQRERSLSREFVCEMVHFLLDAGANPNCHSFILWLFMSSRPGAEVRALLARSRHRVILAKHFYDIQWTKVAAEKDDLPRMELLLEHGAATRCHPKEGPPALFFAKSAAMVHLLVSYGADPNHEVNPRRVNVNHHGSTPLNAAYLNNTGLDVMEALIECGAQPKGMMVDRPMYKGRDLSDEMMARWLRILNDVWFVWKPCRQHCAPSYVRMRVHTSMVLRSAGLAPTSMLPVELMFMIFELI